MPEAYNNLELLKNMLTIQIYLCKYNLAGCFPTCCPAWGKESKLLQPHSKNGLCQNAFVSRPISICPYFPPTFLRHVACSTEHIPLRCQIRQKKRTPQPPDGADRSSTAPGMMRISANVSSHHCTSLGSHPWQQDCEHGRLRRRLQSARRPSAARASGP